MSTINFNVSNPESIIYEHEFLRITVLGGVKLEGLDRMRVTLKIELKQTSLPALRHNLDLYNDTQLEKLIRKGAERLEIGTSVISASLSQLTEALENYRLDKLKEKEVSTYQPKQLTAQEQRSATDFLGQPNLLERTNELIGKSGVIGEENNRLLMYLIFTSRKRAQPLHVVSLAASGTGKTHLQESVANLIPEEDRIELTTLSENAFYYFGQRELKHKLILIEDLDGLSGTGANNGAFYALRELQSKRKISKTIAHKSTNGETKTMHLVVEGPVSVAGCTTKESIYEDNANRSFLIYLDDTKEQDHRIMDYQRRASAGNLDEHTQQEVKELLQNCQRLLQPIKVVNRYAEQLCIPKEVLKPRRTNTHYLQFIEAVTFYHQGQREKKYDKQTGEEYIETTLEDIENTNKLLKDVLLRKSDELTGACRNYFEVLKTFLLEEKAKAFEDQTLVPGQKQKTFTNREMSLKLRISITTIKRHHFDLYNSGYLKIAKKDKLKGYEYEIVSYEEYKDLQKGIDEVLENSLKNLSDANQPSSLEVAQSKNGLVNNQKINKKTTTAQQS